MSEPYAPAPGKPRGFDGDMQCVASAAHRRGVVLIQTDRIVGSVEARELMKTLRAAHENMRGHPQQRRQVEQAAAVIAARLGRPGAVQVSKATWNVISGYARRRSEPTAPGKPAAQKRNPFVRGA